LIGAPGNPEQQAPLRQGSDLLVQVVYNNHPSCKGVLGDRPNN
jgi:hypothetical protein